MIYLRSYNLSVICESILERKQNFGKFMTLVFLGLELRYQGIVKECKIGPNV